MPNDAPKLFISYSWSSPEHEQWVLDLARQLVVDGIDVILDKWELKEGHDSIVFMERMVGDPEISHVLLICDKQYAEKADSRSGGVGTETQIIAPEIYADAKQGKFLAIVAERDKDGAEYLPIYYKNRIYIDLSSGDLFAKTMNMLLDGHMINHSIQNLSLATSLRIYRGGDSMIV